MSDIRVLNDDDVRSILDLRRKKWKKLG